MSHFDALDPKIQRRVQEWLDGPYDEQSKKYIRSLLKDNIQELIDSFYTDLSFGTAGLRGIMGVGSNRLNIYTIRKATQGLANYLNKQFSKVSCPPVFIGFDSRHNSQEFAQEAARVLAGNQIPVLLLKELRPTPFVSFGCRAKHCSAGIMITASHNPKEYNGYKVFWSDGGQVVPPHDEGIIKEVEAIKELTQVKEASIQSPLIKLVDESFDRVYIDSIFRLQFHPEENKRFGKSLKIAYTPLHGTGITLAPEALNSWGFTDVVFVDAQIKPDGDFPTVKFPNPEFKETLELGINKMQEAKADILIANDPDADRTGLVVRHHGQSVILTGNEIASLCVHYIAKTLKERNALPDNGVFVTTIVSSELIKAIAAHYKVACIEVLTGFKYIGEKIHEWETKPQGYHFLFGAEESYGFLLGTFARDKDAIVTSCLLAEIALHSKQEGKTLVDLLHGIYRSYGIFKEKQFSMNFEGKAGAEKILSLMETLRKNPPQAFGGLNITAIEDYEKRIRLDIDTKRNESLILPQSDVLLFRLSDGSKIVVRPSGTEPKIKIYTAVHQKEFKTIEEGMQICENRLNALINDIKKDLKL